MKLHSYGALVRLVGNTGPYATRIIAAANIKDAQNKLQAQGFQIIGTAYRCQKSLIPRGITFHVDSVVEKTTWDAIEVHPVKVVNKEGSVEQCEPNEAQFWSVYLHYTNQGLRCIADCPTGNMAKSLAYLISECAKTFSPFNNL